MTAIKWLMVALATIVLAGCGAEVSEVEVTQMVSDSTEAEVVEAPAVEKVNVEAKNAIIDTWRETPSAGTLIAFLRETDGAVLEQASIIEWVTDGVVHLSVSYRATAVNDLGLETIRVNAGTIVAEGLNHWDVAMFKVGDAMCVARAGEFTEFDFSSENCVGFH